MCLEHAKRPGDISRTEAFYAQVIALVRDLVRKSVQAPIGRNTNLRSSFRLNELKLIQASTLEWQDEHC